MTAARDSEAWGQLTELAKDLKVVIDIILKGYDATLLEGLGLVMRLDGQQIVLEHNEQYPAKRENEGGLLRIDHMKKIYVKKRSQDVLDESGKYVFDIHKRIN